MPKTLHQLTIGFMGNFSPEKGSRVFADLVKLCAAEKLPIKWWIIGGIGDEQSFLRANSLMNVQTTGFYSTEELPMLIKTLKLDLGLILSIFPESYSKLSRECWQQELPLIYNRIGILDSLSFSDFGFQLLQRNLADVVKKLHQISEHPELLAEEKTLIRKTLQETQLVSKNDKHVRYLQLYQSHSP
jgi:hypothetical protein